MRKPGIDERIVQKLVEILERSARALAPQADAPQQPGRPALLAIAIAAAGGGIGIAGMIFLAESAHFALGMVPFATSIVLVLGAPDAPQAQPRNILGGHIISALCGALFCSLLGHGAAAAALGVAAAIAVMQATRTFHPPAGINPVVMVIAQAGWSFVVLPVTLGALILIAYAWIYHRLTHTSPWPRSWLS